MSNNNIIYGHFTQSGPLCEVKPSAEEEACMMRQMTFLPEGLKHETMILMDDIQAKTVLLDERVWVEVRKEGDLCFAKGFGYELDVINNDNNYEK
jgi:hypothetical protein